MAFQEVHVGQFVFIDRYFLAFHLAANVAAHSFEMGGDGVPGERVEEIEGLVGNEVDRFDQEVSGPHGGVDDAGADDLIDEFASGFGGGLGLVGALEAFLFLIKGLAQLAWQFRAQRLEFRSGPARPCSTMY